MVSKIKNLKGGWGFIAGMVVTLLLVPTVAIAATDATIIKGGISGVKADVTGANQLLTTEASPSNSFQSGATNLSTTATTPIGVPPQGSALIVTFIHINTIADPTPGLANGVVVLVESGTTCSSNEQVGSYLAGVNPPTVGETDLSLGPGVSVPAGDAMCALDSDKVEADGSVSGYTVPPSEVTAGPVHTAEPPQTWLT